MTSGDSLRQVAQLVDAMERAGVGVDDITVSQAPNGSVVEMSITLPDGDADLEDLTVPPPVHAQTGAGTGSASDSERGVSVEVEPADAVPAEDENSPGSNDPTPEAAPAGSTEGTVEPDAASDATAPDSNSDSAGEVTESVRCRVDGCDRTFETDHGMKIHAAKAHDAEEGVAQAHRDPEQLRAVYEAHDTFEEMREALDADVTAQTVRRNMMKLGIHEPADNPVEGHAAAVAASDPEEISTVGDEKRNDRQPGAAEESQDTSTAEASPDTDPDDGPPVTRESSGGDSAADDDGGDELPGRDSEQASSQPAGQGSKSQADTGETDARPLETASVPESMALPEGVDLPTLAAAARKARTMYEFTNWLGVDRDTGQELLATFDLTEVVVGRLSERSGSELPEREVVDRILDAIDSTPETESAGSDRSASADD